MIDVAQVLKDCRVDRLVKRVVRQRELAGVIYMIGELREPQCDGKWFYLERWLDPPSFVVLFLVDEAAVLAKLPAAIQREWA